MKNLENDFVCSLKCLLNTLIHDFSVTGHLPFYKLNFNLIIYLAKTILC